MNIVITGASSGIGYELAKKLGANKDNVLFLLSRNIDKLNKLSIEIKEICNETKVHVIAYDLESPDYGKVEFMLKDCEHVDLLINNAGLMVMKGFLLLDSEDWLRIFNVNLFGQVELIRFLFPFLSKAAKPHILNISSMGGFQSSVKFEGLTAYSASKAALANLTEVLALEFSPKNIAVNCLAIGAVETPMLRQTFPDYEPPLNAEEMADFIAYFAVNGHRFFNGKILPVALSTP